MLEAPECVTRAAAAQAYYILDETVLGGFLQEPSKREVLHVCTAQDDLMEDDSAKGR